MALVRPQMTWAELLGEVQERVYAPLHFDTAAGRLHNVKTGGR